MSNKRENDILPNGMTRLEEHASRILASMLSACDSIGNLTALYAGMNEDAVNHSRTLINIIYPDDEVENIKMPCDLDESASLGESLSIKRVKS